MRHIIDCAVSLDFLLDFARNVPDGYSTSDVVRSIILPSTSADRCRYVALPTVPASAVGRSQFFISHRWAANFTRELVVLIAERFAEAADARNASTGCQTVDHVSQNAAQTDRRLFTSSQLVTPDGNDVVAEISAPCALAASISGIQTSFSPSSPCPAGPLDDPPARDLPLPTTSFPRPPYTSTLSATPSPSLQPTTSLSALRTSSRLRADNNRDTLPTSNEGFPLQSTPSATPHRADLQRSWTSSATGGLWLRDASVTSANSSAAATAAPPALTCIPGLLCTPPLPGAFELPTTSEVPSPTSFSGSLNPLHARPSTRPQELLLALPPHLPSPPQQQHPSLQPQPLQGVGSAIYRSYRSERSFQSTGSGGGWGPGDGRGRQGGQQTQQQPRGLPGGMGSLTPGAPPGSNTGLGACLPSRLTSQQGLAGAESLPFSERGALQPSNGPAAASAGVGFCGELATEGTPPDCARGVDAAVATVGGVGGGGGDGVGIVARCSTSEASDAAAGEGTPPAASLGSSTTSSNATGTGSCSRAGSSTCIVVAGGGCTGSGVSGSRGMGVGGTGVGCPAGDRCGSPLPSVTGMQLQGPQGRHGGSMAAGAGTAEGLGNGWLGLSEGLAAAGPANSNVEVVDGLLERFKGRKALLEETFVWLDIFAINQHPDTTQADDLSKLQEVVGASEATLLVFDQGGLVLTRIWCLYEIWQTVQRKGPQVLAGPLDLNQLAHVWGQLDAEQAQTTVDADRVRILADIRATTGTAELNRHIKKAIVESASHDLDVSRSTRPRSLAHAAAAHRAAHLLRIAGSGWAALTAALEAADVFGGCGGRAHGDTLQALRTVAACHKDLGATSMALGLLQQQVIPHLEMAYGTGHTQYEALYDAGMMQYTLGQYDSAYNSLLMALTQQLRQLHAAAPHATSQLAAMLTAGPLAEAAAVAASVAAGRIGLDAVQLPSLSAEHLTTSLASLRVLVADVAPSAPEFSVGVGDNTTSGGGGCTAIAVSASGERRRSGSHRSIGLLSKKGSLTRTAAAAAVAAAVFPAVGAVGGNADGVAGAAERVGLTLHSLGLVQRERGQRGPSSGWSGLLREARELMEGSVALLDAFSGANRGMAALDARANLAELLMAGGEYTSAERLLRANLSLTESVYGGDHPHTATALNNLALCLKRQRSSAPSKVSEALSLYRRCLTVCSGALGEAHPETLLVATNLGVLLADQRQWSESEWLLSRAVAALPGQLGPTHPDALAAHKRLAEVLELRNKLFEAEALFRITLQYAESAPPGSRDHGLVLECREGLTRLEETLAVAARAQTAGACCIIS